MRKRLLELCCNIGGSGEGFRRAGFKVTGVDIVHKERYPFEFIQADAIEYAKAHAHEYDAVSAAPPCQRYTALQKGTNAARGYEYPDLYEPMRDALKASGVPYIIENPAARPDVVLCGEMFGLGVIRHRNFELGGWKMDQPKHIKHRGRVRGYRHGRWFDGPYIAAYGKGGGKGNVQEMQEAMGINWTDVHEELTEAIPPAYTEYIGKHLMAFLTAN
jgi:DNA (cytosine-5)-methyltransferase 1